MSSENLQFIDEPAAMTDARRNIAATKEQAPLERESGSASLSTKPFKPFDPFDYGLEDGYKFWGAVVHLIRVTFGSGILLLPYTMKTSGYVTGTVLLLLVSLFYYHNMHILITHDYRVCKLLNVRHLTYTSLVQKTFENAPFPLNKLAPWLSRILFAYFCLVIYNSTFLLVFAGSCQHLARYANVEYTVNRIVTATMVPLLVFCMLRKMLQRLVPFSAATSFFSLIMAVALLASCAVYRVPNTTIRSFGNVSTIPRTFALHLQAFICTSSIIPVKNHMKLPRRFGTTCGALNVSAVALTFLFGGFALVAYFCFGDATEQNILANLPANNLLSFVIHLLYACSMFVIYLLWFSVIFDNVWPEIEPKIVSARCKWFAEYGLRIAINAWSYFLAVGVPNLALMLTISGTIAIILEVALIPAMELILALQEEQKSYKIIIKDIFIVVVSSVLFYMSIVDCVNEIMRLYAK